jgi:TonB-linked SusC/RagA family outer membrane protein
MIMRNAPGALPLLNPDGTYGFSQDFQQNSLPFFSRGFNSVFTNNMEGTVILNHKLNYILPGLSFKGNISFSNEYAQTTSRSRSTNFRTYIVSDGGKDASGKQLYNYTKFTNGPLFEPPSYSSSIDGGASRKIYLEASLFYTKEIEKHKFTALALYNRTRNVFNSSTFDWPFSYEGLVSRLTYSYNDKYLFETNMGYNGSENFKKGNRFGFFPSFSAGWVVSNEPFMKKFTWLSQLKLRGSWGQVGNDQIGTRFLFFENPYATTTGYTFGLAGGNTVTGYSEGALGNPAVTWEKSNKQNYAVELSFLKGLLGLNLDVFREDRSNILMNPGTVPTTVGIGLPAANIGKTENKGFEIELIHDHNITNNFNYQIKLNYARARNKRVFLDEPEAPYPWMRNTGTPIGTVRGLVTAGFFNSQAEIDAWPVTTFTSGTTSGKLQPGDIKYVDQNGDKKIDNFDMVPIGYTNIPENTFGANISGSFSNGILKGLDFNVLLQGADKTSMALSAESIWEFFNKGKVLDIHLERWSQARYNAGEKITYPRLSSSPSGTLHNYVSSDFWYLDAAYLRLKTVEIGYTLPKSLLSKVNIANVRVYTNGFNLYTWSGIRQLDPENRNSRGWYYYQQKVFNMGLNITL